MAGPWYHPAPTMSWVCFTVTLPFLILGSAVLSGHLTLGFLTRAGDSESGYKVESKLKDAGSNPEVVTPNHTITVAVLTDISSSLYSTTGYENLAAARLAIEDINADKSFLPGYHFDMLFKDDGCDMEVGLKALTNAYDNDENKKINAVIGISCSVVCELAGYLCATDQWNIPVVSHSCSSDDLSKTDKYPTFARLSLSVFKYTNAIIAVCKKFEWTKVGLMVNNIDWYVKTAGKMKELMTDKEKNGVYGIQVFLEKFYYDDEDDDGSMDESSDTYKLLVEQLNRMKQKVRVIIIVGYARDIIFVLKTAKKQGMNNGHFAFLTQEFIQADLKKDDKELIQSIQGVLDLEPLLNKSDPNYISFSERVRKIVDEKQYPKTGKDVANLIAAQMYDAVWLYAKSLKRAVDQNYGIEDGEWLVESMTGSKWNGMSGEIRIDEAGDRLGNVQIMNIQSGDFKQVGTWWMSKNESLELSVENIAWPGAPEEHPAACGRQYELCETYSDAVAKITLMALVCMAFLFGLLVRLYLYNRTNK